MILSHKHRFVFIKGVKVAGTSVEIALSQICGPDDIITPISPADERYRLGTCGEPRNYSTDHSAERAYLESVAGEPIGAVRLPKSPFYNHMPLRELLDRVPEAEAYWLIFVERSPYEKVISFAHWSEHRRAYDEGGALPDAPREIDAAIDRAIADRSIMTVRNIDRYRDRSGRIPVKGWRYENLAQDLDAFFEELGADAPPLVHAKRGLSAAGADPARLLSHEQIEFINQAFADEFVTFGYAML